MHVLVIIVLFVISINVDHVDVQQFIFQKLYLPGLRFTWSQFHYAFYAIRWEQNGLFLVPIGFCAHFCFIEHLFFKLHTAPILFTLIWHQAHLCFVVNLLHFLLSFRHRSALHLTPCALLLWNPLQNFSLEKRWSKSQKIEFLSQGISALQDTQLLVESWAQLKKCKSS